MKKCLVADDSKLVRLVARKIFADLDVETVEAASAAEALDIAANEMPDTILVDWGMPGMNGLDFLRALRARPEGDRPYVIFCTTEDDDRHMREAYDAGADDCILKPFDHEMIRSRMAQVGAVR